MDQYIDNATRIAKTDLNSPSTSVCLAVQQVCEFPLEFDNFLFYAIYLGGKGTDEKIENVEKFISKRFHRWE